jgi:hypothetical protein
MLIAFKVTLLIVGIMISILIYSVVYGSILCSIHHAKAIGLAVLYTDPLYWLLLLLIAGGEAWFGKRIVSN